MTEQYNELVDALDNAGVLILQEPWAREIQAIVERHQRALIKCWNCLESFTHAERADNEGLCPHCYAEADL